MKRQTIVALGAMLLLVGCASVPTDGGLAELNEITQPRVKQPLAPVGMANDRVRELLSRPLSAEDAVGIALLSHPSLQATYAELGVAEADLAQAGRLRNPGFSIARNRQGSEREIERHFTLDIVGLVTMPWRLELERATLAGTRLGVARDVIAIAGEARRAWIEAVAAAESVRYAARVLDAADAGAELAAQMVRAGNWSRLQDSRERLSQAEAATRLELATHTARAARERLVRALGLQGAQLDFTLPERLPDLPAAPRELHDAESTAIANRLDVLATKHEADALARSFGLTRVTGFVNVLELGYEHSSSNEQPGKTGYEISLELPVFDWGEARVARAEARYRQTLAQAAATALRARSEVREEHHSYLTSYAVARRYREEILPLRARMAEENLLRYNGMLIGVWELLADAREQSAAVMEAIEATRAFWIADARLETALLTGSPRREPS